MSLVAPGLYPSKGFFLGLLFLHPVKIKAAMTFLTLSRSGHSQEAKKITCKLHTSPTKRTQRVCSIEGGVHSVAKLARRTPSALEKLRTL